MTPAEITVRLTHATITLIESALGLRFLFRLFNADSSTLFVSWLYDTTRPLLDPVLEQVPQVRVGEGFVLEFPTLIAMVGYAVLGYLVLVLVGAWQDKAKGAKIKKRFSVSLRER